jgi:sugar transferase (PEP-CTERM/EpsH1 system associated)
VKYRVLHVIPQFSIGGREKVVHSLIRGLNGDFFECSLVSLKDSVPPPGFFTSEDLGLLSLGKRNQGVDLFLISRLRRFIAQNKFHIVHVHNPGTLIYGGIAAKLAGVRVIVNTEHGYSYSISRKKKLAESLLRNRISTTIAVCDALKRYLCLTYSVKGEKVVVIRNGIDANRYFMPDVNPELRKELGKENKTIIGAIGRLDPIKGHKVLLEAFSECLQQNRSMKLVVVGDGPLRKPLENLASSLGIHEHILFMGNRLEIPQILTFIDIFVLPSLNEGLSITLLEAMAAGKAIIATNVGGNPEVIDDAENGILVKPESPSVLAQAMLDLAKDNERRVLLGRAAREKVVKCFSRDQFVAQIQSLYFNQLNRLS